MSDVIVFDTHPYDADWWTSGLAILLKEINWNVNYVCVGPTTRPTKANANKSAKILGVERRFWEIPIIGNDRFAGNLRKKVPAIMKELKAKMVFIPSFYDCHCVNVTLAREMLALFHWSSGLGLGGIEVYSYDSHENLWPVEIYVDVSKTWTKQKKALAMHATFECAGIPDNSLIRVKQGRAQLLGASVPVAPVEYAEGYRQLQADKKCISSLPKLLPGQFYFRSPTGMLEM